jgi:integrase
LDTLFRRARKRAKLEGFTFHDSRHTAATRIALSGRVNVLELCKIFGWKSATQALTYFNPTADDLAAKLG